MVLFWESWTDSLQEQGSTWSSLGQIFLHNNVAHVRHQTCSKSCWTAAHKSWTAAHLQWRSQPASMGSTQEHIQEGLPKNCSSTKSLSDSLQQKLLGSSLQSWRAAPLPLVSPCVSPLSKLAKVGQQQLPSCWTAALYAAPINSKAGSTTLLSMQQLPRGQSSMGCTIPQAGSKDKKKGERKGGVPAPLFGRNFRWTARGWKGFQHQILKGSPCIAKPFLGFW